MVDAPHAYTSPHLSSSWPNPHDAPIDVLWAVEGHLDGDNHRDRFLRIVHKHSGCSLHLWEVFSG